MATYLAVEDINALGDGTKLVFTEVDGDLEESVRVEIFSQVGVRYDTTTWINTADTPKLILKIMAMFYVGYYYQRVYSEDDNPNNYGFLQIQRGQRLIDGIIADAVDLPDIVIPPKNNSQPSFFPNDASSALVANFDDPSLGGPKFTMSKVF